ncbi:tektin-4-like [Octopus sinensis]|uniref:Tektin n=1 Tax=Octopus sinensis TaxID=2607531 RepID=A0A6P7TWA6_9MOLL|nr:tektin-4-like [Octopus sinensis]
MKTVIPRRNTPMEWATFSLNNINRNTETVKQSADLRAKINSVLTDTSRDLREMSDRVEMSVGLRINQVETALEKLKDNLRLVTLLERNWKLINESISTLKQKENELENALKRCNETKLQTQDQIQRKEQSLFIDRNKFLPVRRRYPSTITLLGYPN